MINNIDITDGSFHLDSGVVLTHNMSREQIIATGVTTYGEIDSKDGWYWMYLNPGTLFGKEVYAFSLILFSDKLKLIQFSLENSDAVSVLEGKKINDDLLTSFLGMPQKNDMSYAAWEFMWGELYSCLSTGTEEPCVVMTWH